MTKPLTHLLPRFEDGGQIMGEFIVCDDELREKPEFVRATSAGLPVVIEITDENTDSIRQRIYDMRSGEADAYCFGFPNEPYSKGITTYSGIQYYQIQKPFWEKVEGVLRAFWERAENSWVGGEIK